MRSFMLQRFAGYGKLCRIGGCLFIQNFHKESLASARVTWKCPYTLYSILCVCFVFSFEVAFLALRMRVLSLFSSRFTQSLLFILHITIIFKIFINFWAMATGSGKLLDFFRKAVIFEKSTGFSCVKGRFRWPIPRRCLVLAALVANYVIGVRLFIGEVVNALPRQWILAATICGYVAGFGFVLYDSLPFVVLRCSTEALVEYTHSQMLAFKGCDRTKGACTDMNASRRIETIRLNLCNIRELNRLLNDMWKCPLTAMCANVILMSCIVLYSLFENGIYMREVWVVLLYTLYSALCFFELTLISQALSDEVQRLKDATRAVITTDATEDYLHQLRVLHDTIEPLGMCLSGGGFFSLKKPLLVSMTAAIITYTVILVQTSDDITEKTDVYSAFPRR
ncbi:hypothetical protein IscW_ISCW011825 [Ixodes scapularis]|uniref:Uncharacterized protein n=1 Tax=Ixodes scapularis TaxID=6945 RepID=B7Q4G0_IXOSC|nr:hypothetical protein IscW_ISCW011825 [Ixodes scapularis]|eukprot:XP_002411538.1 hypothetical protein IscW_ISCW011825 [Ixodes scapularis]